MVSLKDNRLTTKKYGVVYCEEYVKEAIQNLNSIKFAWSDCILGFQDCECESRLRVIEYKGKKCNKCYNCLKKEIFGDFNQEKEFKLIDNEKELIKGILKYVDYEAYLKTIKK